MLQIGASAYREVRITEDLVRRFSEVSGDFNPIHLDQEYASKTKFGRRIAHGMLLAGFISAILANDLPGPGTIYLNQELKFTAPVFLDELVRIEVECIELQEKFRAKFATRVIKSDSICAIDGEALVIYPH